MLKTTLLFSVIIAVICWLLSRLFDWVLKKSQNTTPQEMKLQDFDFKLAQDAAILLSGFFFRVSMVFSAFSAGTMVVATIFG